jgi:hypothetical protein
MIGVESECGRGYSMRANGEHTAPMPILLPPAVEDVEKEKRKNRHGPSWRLRQVGTVPAGHRSGGARKSVNGFRTRLWYLTH